MRASLFAVSAALLALPGFAFGARVSQEGNCGGKRGPTCLGSEFGDCCSQYGWCGSTSAYCDAGCQPGFGKCNSNGQSSSSSASPSITTTTTTRATITTARSTNTNDLPVTDTRSSTGTKTTTSTSSSASATATFASLLDCLTAKKLQFSSPSSPSYAQLSKPYNLRLPWKPIAVVLGSTVQDVQAAVTCAALFKVKVQARSGGHSYAAFSLGGGDGSLVVDLAGLQAVGVDAASGVASVGGGVRLGNLASALYAQGRRAVSHGTCPGVGIGGHFTHGGFGYSSRAWGLALDSIVALDVVLANGTAVKASAAANADLFYALRGAAESFGIVTAFHLATQPAPESVVNWSVQLPGMFASADKGARALLHVQDFARNASVVDANLGLGIYMDGETFSISGTYFGSRSRFEGAIRPELLRGLGAAPSGQNTQVVDWITSLTLLGGGGSLAQPTEAGAYDEHDTFLAKSLTVPEASPLTPAAARAYFQRIISSAASVGQAGGSWFTIMNLYGGPGSQINTVPASASAYSHRSTLWVFQNYGSMGNAGGSSFPAAIGTFLQGLGDAIKSAMPGVEFAAYSNYVDPTLSAAQAHDQYYGASTYAKLLGLKSAFDPQSLFWNPQAIGA
ncbi:hypothetical protein RB595_008701 [Gaeumannomyces hyphopodioides]